jgi:hypothetical protein
MDLLFRSFRVPLRGSVGLLAAACVVAGLCNSAANPADPPAAGTPAVYPLPQEGRAQKQKGKDAYLRRTLVEAYERVGRKNPKWDAAARQTLTLLVAYWSTSFPEVDQQPAVVAAVRKAIAAGCDDPLIIYVHARVCNSPEFATWEERDRRYAEAARALDNSGYCAERRALAQVHAALYKLSKKELAKANAKEAEALLNVGLRLLPEVAKDKTVPHHTVFALCEKLMDGYFEVLGDRKAGVDKVAAALAKPPANESLVLLCKGYFYIKYAWDARGDGLAPTVTTEGWQLHRDRLQEAETALEAAWKLDPQNPVIARQMMTVELGQGKGRDRLELWFRRAMELDPNYLDACSAKLYYLEPKWHGNAEEMLAFGRQCLTTGNWEGQLPIILTGAHERLKAYVKPADDYWKRPGVWEDVRAVHESYLKLHPDSKYYRTRLAKLAFLCGQYAQAHRHFEVLGPNYWRLSFTGPDEYERMRAEAQKLAIKK